MIEKAGKYVVTGVPRGAVLKSANENWYVELVLDTTEGTIPWRGFLTEKTLEKTLSILTGLGFKGNSLQELSSSDKMFAVSPGTTVTVAEEDYEGRKSLKAKYVNFSLQEDVEGLKQFLKQNKINEKLTHLLSMRRSEENIPF